MHPLKHCLCSILFVLTSKAARCLMLCTKFGVVSAQDRGLRRCGKTIHYLGLVL